MVNHIIVKVLNHFFSKKSERRWSAGLVLISVEPARPLLAKVKWEDWVALLPTTTLGAW